MTEQECTYLTRLIAVQEALTARLEALERLALNHTELHSKEHHAIAGHNEALAALGTLLKSFDEKLRQLNGNDATLQAEFLRLREVLAKLNITRPTGAVC